MNHYPHHIGDFDRATRHLTRLERSVYRDLLDLYYDTESRLTLDLPALCRKILATSNEESTAVEQTLNEFFNETSTGWVNARCEMEIALYRANSTQRAKAGKASAEAKRLKKLEIQGEKPTGVTTPVEHPLKSVATKAQQNSTNQNQNQNHINTPLPPLGVAGFAEFWQAYPRKVGKGKAETIWKRLKLNSLLPEVLTAIAAQCRTEQWQKDGGQFIPNPATWLCQKRWEDEAQVGAAVAIDPESRTSIEARGVQVGIGKWDEVSEQWGQYKTRVLGAGGGV